MNKNKFVEELKKLNIPVTEEKMHQLDKYYQLLKKENNKYNLTAITEENEVYLKHFYDSLTITKLINLTNQTICDVGAGAGFPGIVLKIMYPELNLTLIDATTKKCHFLSLVVAELGLKNVTIINDRIEIYAKKTREKYDIVTCRAVAPLKILLELSIPLIKKYGYFIPLKGNIDNEVNNIEVYYTKLNIKLIEKNTFKLPIEQSTRTILKYQKQEITNLKYPRNYNEIKKRSLSWPLLRSTFYVEKCQKNKNYQKYIELFFNI